MSPDTKTTKFDTSDLVTDIDLVEYKEPLLTKEKLLRASRALRVSILCLLGGMVFASVGLADLSALVPNFTDFGTTATWALTAAAFVFGVMILIGIPFIIIEKMKIRLCIRRDAYVLVKATLTEVQKDASYEDTGDCCMVYTSQEAQSRTIKLKQHSTPVELFSENPTAYFLYVSGRKGLEPQPSVLFLGKDFHPGDDVIVA